MKQKTYILLALCLAVSTVAVAQPDEPMEEPVVTLDQELRNAPDYTVFARLVEACGLNEVLSQWRDEAYEQAVRSGQLEDLPQHPTEQIGTIPLHRNYGYTIFAETDVVWEALLGKSAANITVEDVKSYITAHGLYAQATTDNNYADPNNIINQFTTYHILPEKLSPEQLVFHYNENGYYWKTSGMNFTIPVEEFYQTLGLPRLLKIYESRESMGIFLNRFPELRNGRGRFTAAASGGDPNRNDYHESGDFRPLIGDALSADENLGIMVLDRTQEEHPYVSVVNGFIYPLQQLLAYTENVQNQLGTQRLRFDVASLLPEMMNNGLRRPLTQYSDGSTLTRGFPVTQDYPYFERLTIEPGSQFYYMSGLDRGWSNCQGDEFNVVGRYDFTLQLPPVPKNGEYELRFGVSASSWARGIAQFFIGSDKENLQATGLPLDLRLGGKNRRFRTGNIVSNIGWSQDVDDDVQNRLVDLRLYEQGYMKGPNAYLSGASATATPLRSGEWCLRRIVWRGYLEAGKTYFLRVKNSMNDATLQFYMDYIEWCPCEVYDNPSTPEDIW